MTLPNSLRAYEDCEDLFRRALDDPKGARACVGSHESAIQLRTRMHYFRTLDRKANAETYAEDHPSHGTSVYDPLVVQLRKDPDDEWWLYIEPRGARILAIEGLSEPHLLAYEEEQLVLEDNSKVIEAVNETREPLKIESISTGATFRRI